MKIERAREMGFCFGVRRAIDLLDKAAGLHGGLETLGPVVHNRQVVDSLSKKGIAVIGSPEEARGRVVAIPSHGAAPEVRERVQELGLTLVDATCPIVRSAQLAAQKLARAGFAVALFGEADHTEVRGVLAYSQGKGRAVQSVEELGRWEPFPRRLGILPQTTQNPALFARFVNDAVSSFLSGMSELRIVNTVCDATRQRQAAAQELARRVELILVIGGRHSANTRRLAETCAAGAPTHLIETAAEIDDSWLEGKRVVGITAGASTPDDAIAEVVSRLQALS